VTDLTDPDGDDLGTPNFVIAGAWSGIGAFQAQQVLSGIPASVPTAAYTLLNFDPAVMMPGGVMFNQVLAGLSAVCGGITPCPVEQALGFMAVDVECQGTYNGTMCAKTLVAPLTVAQVAANNTAIYQAIETVEQNNLKPVLYTNESSWDEITGGDPEDDGTTAFGCIPLWHVSYDGVASLNPQADTNPQLPFGGWTSRVGKQYDAGPGNAGLLVSPPLANVDLDIFDLSVFSPPNDASAPRACDNNPSECLALDFTADARFGGFIYNPGTKKWGQVVVVTNPVAAAQPIPAPISLAFDGLDGLLSPSIAPPLSNAGTGVAGQTSCTYPTGSRYINLTSSPLNPGQSLTVPILFSQSAPGPINPTYTPRILAGPATR
jgi:hypothetical protein